MAAPDRTNSHSSELRSAARALGRRRFLTTTGAAAALAFAVNLPGAGAAAADELEPARLTEDPFTLGVASGDPLPDSVALWTRLAPRPLELDGGLPDRRISVRWEIAHDERFRRIARRGYAWAHPEFDHSVHVDVRNLRPGTVYHYRFRAGDWISPAGRTRTAPRTGSRVDALKFGLVSCQRYDQGHWTAYRHLAGEDLDAVFHLGDYLYEYAVNAQAGGRGYTDRVIPAHFNHETVTLEDYRLRYALYKSDPDLIAAHLAHPFVVTWDDHETENNYAGDTPENTVPPEEFLLRRAAAYRAYWENMPLRAAQRPEGADLRLYRRMHWGDLAQFDVLDTRQYRTDQANGDGWKTPTAASEAESMTLTGAEQERWLTDGWRRSSALWNVVPQQVTFSRRNNPAAGDTTLSMDSWDGYPASRRRVLEGWKASGQENLMVLTGDVHVHYGLDIKEDFDDPSSRTLGTEVVTSSVSSGGNGAERPANWAGYLERNPHLRFYNGLRGYTTVELGRREARTEFKTVDRVTVPGAPLTVAGAFVTESGNPGLTPA
ncbi:alkaline phosphatase D family protein [Streptomyces abyssomicinicus]|uniref:alkaline phosphatase D family protein n=1 Tax=Streptomyces abyssomicinicus TaxID=574929 RepID=UPI00124F937B|nr:alkaline phosphatase D family protein [Streptomyces abyssomicinicus]